METKETLYAPAQIVEKQVNKNDRTIKGIITTNEVDRIGDIIETKGINLKNYKTNPIVLFNHDYFSVVEKSERTKYFKDGKVEGIEATTRFADTMFASEIFDLASENILNAFSVGIRVVEREARTQKDKYLGEHIRKSDLLEYSVVSVPANASAVQVKALIGLKDDVSEETYKKINPFHGFENFIEDYEGKYKELADELADLKSLVQTPEEIINQISRITKVDAHTQVHNAEKALDQAVKNLGKINGLNKNQC